MLALLFSHHLTHCLLTCLSHTLDWFIGARAPLVAEEIEMLTTMLKTATNQHSSASYAAMVARARLNKAKWQFDPDDDMTAAVRREWQKAESSRSDAKAYVASLRSQLNHALDMEGARSFSDIFLAGHKTMAFDSTSKYFHILDAPKGAFFPFGGGESPNDAPVQRLLLRKSHNGLYSLLLAQLRARKAGQAGAGRTFLVRGPPGTGKSAMLNLVWYIARFKLGMNVICHYPNNDVHLYCANDDAYNPVEKLRGQDEAKCWMLKEDTVYLFDSGKNGNAPIYTATGKAISVLTTAPYVGHYRVVCQTAVGGIACDKRVHPLWSFAWETAEITEAFTLLRKVYSPLVGEVVARVKGDFRFALETADGHHSTETVREGLKNAVDTIGAKALDELSHCSDAAGLIDALYVDNSISTKAFKNVHWLLTIVPTPSSEAPIVWSPQAWLDDNSRGGELHTDVCKTHGSAYGCRHLKCSLAWVNPDAPRLLRSKFRTPGTSYKVSAMIDLISGDAQ